MFGKCVEGAELGKISGNCRDTDFSSLYRRISIIAAIHEFLCQVHQNALCHQSSNDLAKKAFTFTFLQMRKQIQQEEVTWQSHKSGRVILLRCAGLPDKYRSLKMECVALMVSSLSLKVIVCQEFHGMDLIKTV